jgi:hypothetical protein
MMSTEDGPPSNQPSRPEAVILANSKNEGGTWCLYELALRV